MVWFLKDGLETTICWMVFQCPVFELSALSRDQTVWKPECPKSQMFGFRLFGIQMVTVLDKSGIQYTWWGSSSKVFEFHFFVIRFRFQFIISILYFCLFLRRYYFLFLCLLVFRHFYFCFSLLAFQCFWFILLLCFFIFYVFVRVFCRGFTVCNCNCNFLFLFLLVLFPFCQFSGFLK